jgi:hypothetical protein
MKKTAAAAPTVNNTISKKFVVKALKLAVREAAKGMKASKKNSDFYIAGEQQLVGAVYAELLGRVAAGEFDLE